MKFSLKHVFIVSLSTLLMLQLAFAQVNKKANGNNKVKNQTSGSSNGAKAALTVKVVNPTYRSIGQNVQATGSIEAREIASVTSQVAGLSLSKLYVDIGDTIKKGQLLAEYDASSVKNDIAQANAALEQAKLGYEQARLNARRAQKLRKSKAVSALELDNYEFQEKQAKAQIESAKAILNNQKLRNSYAQVRAKIDGLITDKQAVLGAVGNPGTQLFTVMVDSELEWQANVPSEFLNLLSPNTDAYINMAEHQTASNEQEDNKIDGKVRKIDPTVNNQTRLGKVYVSLEQSDALRRGMFVSGAFLVGETKVLTIPASAIRRVDGFDYVFTVEDDNRVLRKKITVGRVDGEQVSVIDGLTDKAQVVSSGVGFLNSGDLVRTVD